jgi:hypothetical protein
MIEHPFFVADTLMLHSVRLTKVEGGRTFLSRLKFMRATCIRLTISLMAFIHAFMGIDQA